MRRFPDADYGFINDDDDDDGDFINSENDVKLLRTRNGKRYRIQGMLSFCKSFIENRCARKLATGHPNKMLAFEGWQPPVVWATQRGSLVSFSCNTAIHCPSENLRYGSAGPYQNNKSSLILLFHVRIILHLSCCSKGVQKARCTHYSGLRKAVLSLEKELGFMCQEDGENITNRHKPCETDSMAKNSNR